MSDTDTLKDTNYFPSYEAKEGGFEANFQKAMGEMLTHKCSPTIVFLNLEGFRDLTDALGERIDYPAHEFIGVYAGTPIVFTVQSDIKFRMVGLQK